MTSFPAVISEGFMQFSVASIVTGAAVLITWVTFVRVLPPVGTQVLARGGGLDGIQPRVSRSRSRA
jgi:hypothetical protein